MRTAFRSGSCSCRTRQSFDPIGRAGVKARSPNQVAFAIRSKPCPTSIDLKIPTGFHPSAQGCGERATLGDRETNITTLMELWPDGARLCPAVAGQPQRGERMDAFNSPELLRLVLRTQPRSENRCNPRWGCG